MEMRVSYIRGFLGVFITLMLCCYIAKAWNSSTTTQTAQVEVEVPCFFIFGDSLVDNGNNNDIPTFVRSNFLPYGIDFPRGPTGRFTNGRTFVDGLAELLGFPDFIPPFSGARFTEILQGANFASGAAGIRDETGNYLGANVPMNEQIRNFAIVIDQIRQYYFRGDENSLQNHVSKCIIYSGIGNNDYLNNYLMPWQYPSSSLVTPEDFATMLLEEYERQITVLYDLGVRKMIIPNIAQMGCIPLKRLKNGTEERQCNEEENNVIQPFNLGLRNLVDALNNGRLPGATLVYLDFYEACKNLDYNRKSYGLEVVDKGCCGAGKNIFTGGEITCLPFQTPCEDRNKYFFWDAFHPSEIVHMILAKNAYSSDSNSYAHPINIKQLAML